MLPKFLLIFCLFPFLSALERNDRPIIAIMAQERAGDNSISFIAVPYVKHIEASGARLIPVLMEQDDEYYKNIVRTTNGLILPGGNRNITGSSFSHAAELLFKFATEANDRGEHFPIYGVCQGLQIVSLMILEHWAKDPNPSWLANCVAEDISVNLKFPGDPKESRIFQNATADILNTLQTENVTPNYHRKCITPTNFTASDLHKHLRIVTTSFDKHGLEFVSTFESLNASRPIYLLQWHPEKILIEFKVIKGAQMNTKHTPSAIVMAQYMGNFIVGEARRNLNRFATQEAENKALIFNCDPLYTMGTSAEDRLEREHFSQIYLFSSFRGCGGADWSSVYYMVAIGALSLVLLVFVGVFVGQKILSKRRSYQEIGDCNS